MFLGIELGSWPAWLSTVVTSGLAIVALVTYRKAVHDKESEQASQIAAWTTESFDPDGSPSRVLFLANYSAAPVFELTAKPYDIPGFYYGILTAGETEDHALPAIPEERAPDAKRLAVKFNYLGIVRTNVSIEFPQGEPLPELEFRDRAGQWWMRDGRGRLRKTQPRVGNPRSTVVFSIFGFKLFTAAADLSNGGWKLERYRHTGRKEA